MPQTFVKDPQSVLDYKVDWSTWLASTSPEDTISTSTWTVESGITKDTDSSTSTTATIWLSGGTAGSTYAVTNKVVTNAGRTKEVTIYVTVRQR